MINYLLLLLGEETGYLEVVKLLELDQYLSYATFNL